MHRRDRGQNRRKDGRLMDEDVGGKKDPEDSEII